MKHEISVVMKTYIALFPYVPVSCLMVGRLPAGN